MLNGTVVDQDGHPVQGARITTGSRPASSAVTDSAGIFHLPLPTASAVSIEVNAPGFAPQTRSETLPWKDGEGLRIVLTPAGEQQQVTVTAYRVPLPENASPTSTWVITPAQLHESAAPSLDGKLRQVPGLELFRRSSSLVANPTSQGLSLRGLGSTAASRTLLVSNDVPLNDPFGGWIHWEEVPELDIQSVEVARGGASDLYGSSAIGGVVNLLQVRPDRDMLTLLGSYRGENTPDAAVLASTSRGRWGGLVTGGLLRTDGYILVAPAARGQVDIPSNVHSQNGAVDISFKAAPSLQLFLRGNGFNEARSNGTPLQTNATRVWRYSFGADQQSEHFGSLSLRLYGSDQNYRQSFSSIAADRASEKLTRRARIPTQQLGGALHWSLNLRPTFVLLAGTDTHDVRATSRDQAYSANRPTVLTDITARQRQTGVYGEALWSPQDWTVAASARVDHFSNFDALRYLVQTSGVASQEEPNLAETVFDPRLGITRKLGPNVAVFASGFRAYRAPTENELYRNGQVGQELTLANPSLRSERATGWETGAQLSGRGATGLGSTSVRASYFWTEINRPITALTLSVSSNSIVKQRVNLGQLQSRGVSIDVASHPAPGLEVEGGYQYADATVTEFAPQPGLVGKWLPQVARNSGTLQIRATRARLGTLNLQGRISGRQFDDDQNLFLLHGYFRLDAYVSHSFGSNLEMFASAENLFDRTVEVGRTPVLTLGTPLVGRIGVKYTLGR